MIFISYGKEDRSIAQGIRSILEKEGYSVAMPEEQFLAGASTDETVKASITSSGLVVGLITQANIGSAWVNQELGYAMATGVRTCLILGNGVNAGGLFSGSTNYIKINENNPGDAAISASTAIKSAISNR